MTETVKLHNLETGEKTEVTKESAEELLKQDNFIPDEGTGKNSEEISEVEKLGEKIEPETVWDEIDRELDEKQTGELPPKWKPSENEDHPDRLKGTVNRTGPENYGKTLIIEDLDGNEWFIPSGRKTLEDFMKKAEVGDKVGLKFAGMEKSGETGRKYENYQTVVKKSE